MKKKLKVIKPQKKENLKMLKVSRNLGNIELIINLILNSYYLFYH